MYTRYCSSGSIPPRINIWGEESRTRVLAPCLIKSTYAITKWRGGGWTRELPVSLLRSLSLVCVLFLVICQLHSRFACVPQSCSRSLARACAHVFSFILSLSLSLHRCSSLCVSFSLFLSNSFSFSLSVCKSDQTRAHVIGEPNKNNCLQTSLLSR